MSIQVNGRVKTGFDVAHWLGLACQWLGIRTPVLEVTFLSRTDMKALNTRVLGHAYVTDIITFDLSDGADWSAELYVCMPLIRQHARQQGVAADQELQFVLAHGLLHTKGYQDDTPHQREAMFEAQYQLLAGVNG